MSIETLTPRSSVNGARRIVTSGYSTVDIIRNGVIEAAPGGTAVNVAAALATLGWDASVVGTVGSDPTGDFLRDALRTAGVSVSHLRQDKRWVTPVVLQERQRNDHSWRFSCPICGARFAKHRPSPVSHASELLSQLSHPDVFMFDRTSLFTLELATEWSKQGTLIVFEPAALGRPSLFDRAADVADVIKFSTDRSVDFEERLAAVDASLIRTLGRYGAEYRARGQSEWARMPAPSVAQVVDTAGAGDWTTAGFLDTAVNSSGKWGSKNVLEEAVARGQEFGARACTWEGVRPEKPLTFEREAFEQFACPAEVARRRESEEFVS